MANMKTKTQKYIEKYCEYIDRLLGFWKNGADSTTIYGVVKKAEFIHRILEIEKKLNDFSGELINSNIGYPHDGLANSATASLPFPIAKPLKRVLL